MVDEIKKRGPKPKVISNLEPSQESIEQMEKIESEEIKVKPVEQVIPPPAVIPGAPVKEETVSISKKEWDEVNARLKLLYEVADKGRVFNYENQKAEKKPIKVKLSIYNNKIIIGWRTLRDELVKHPTTGKTVGEKQEYEIMLLDKEGNQITMIVDGYDSFSNARYGERIEAEVISRKEDWQGNTTFNISLPDGRKIELDSRFVN
jgi:hypothetical protein